MDPKKSNFASLIEEICREEGITWDSYSYDWGHRLQKDGKVRYIVGYQFPLNLASVKEVCQDKVLTYQILNAYGIPAVEHVFIPANIPSTGLTQEDHDKEAKKMLDAYQTIVVKDTTGTGGNKVFKAATLEEFHEAQNLICASAYSACISPFYEIENEFRVILLDGEPLITIRKDRAFTLNEKGEKVYENWKHNLGQGAVGVILKEEEIPDGIHEISKEAVRVLGARFVSVDVIVTEGRVLVLEINGGVMMEHLSGQSQEYFEIAKSVYKKAILRAFEEA